MGLRAGELREQIIISSPVRTKNDSGGSATVFAQKLVTRAAVKELKSDPNLLASQEDIIQLVSFRIRYRPVIDILNGDQLTWRGNEFTVNSIKVDHLRIEIEIICRSEINTSNRSQ